MEIWKFLVFEIFFSSIFLFVGPFFGPDLRSYREQLAMVRAGELDYRNIYGEYGPLVYPGGHVLCYWLLSVLGGDRFGVFGFQVWFTAIYFFTIYVVLKIYETAKLPKWTLIASCLSIRVHAIFISGCFNDGIQVLFSQLAVYYFVRRNFLLGCVFHSLAVSVKMSAFLFSPGILVLLLRNLSMKETAKLLVAGCALPQLALGAPFLWDSPKSYFVRAFDFSRKFVQEQSWNWFFLPENVFDSFLFAGALLLLTICCLAVFLGPRSKGGRTTVEETLEILHVSNFIGCVFLRSMHRQFYAWVYWSYPVVASKLPWPYGPMFICLTELWINSLDSNSIASLVLQLGHAAMLYGLLIDGRKTTKIK